MKILDFTYVDAKGKETVRRVVVSVEPSDKYAGTDISDLNKSELWEYASLLEEYKAVYTLAIAKLNSDFGLDKNYRQFFESKMTNVVTTNI